MSATSAVKQFAAMKLSEACESCKDKDIPNLIKIDDSLTFGIRITEGDLNFQVIGASYPVGEAGPGNFLINISACFLSRPIRKAGVEFLPAPIGPSISLDFTIYAEDEQELQNGILQLIQDEVDNILCQILE